jgi:hypothetical protein
MDRQQEILARLFEVLKTCLDKPEHAFRNKLNLPDHLRPAIIMFDGDENTADDVDSYGRHRAPGAQAIMMDAVPEIYVFVEGKEDEVGPALAALRAKILKAIYTDETLVALCANGDIRYQGYATGFATGKKVEAEAGIQISFRYVLRPTQL